MPLPVSAAEPVAPHEAETLANRVVELLSKGEPRSVARLMHYPAAYTEKQREKDMTEVETLMSLLLRRFGTPSAAKHEIRPVAFFEMGGGGAEYQAGRASDVRRWSGLSAEQAGSFTPAETLPSSSW
jgi:hypothetical protein